MTEIKPPRIASIGDAESSTPDRLPPARPPVAKDKSEPIQVPAVEETDEDKHNLDELA